MGDRAVKTKAPTHGRVPKETHSVPQKMKALNVDEEFNEREIFETVYRPINEASKVAYMSILDIIKSSLNDVQSSTVKGTSIVFLF
jgi:hypothetical protein